MIKWIKIKLTEFILDRFICLWTYDGLVHKVIRFSKIAGKNWRNGKEICIITNDAGKDHILGLEQRCRDAIENEIQRERIRAAEEPSFIDIPLEKDKRYLVWNFTATLSRYRELSFSGYSGRLGIPLLPKYLDIKIDEITNDGEQAKAYDYWFNVSDLQIVKCLESDQIK